MGNWSLPDVPHPSDRAWVKDKDSKEAYIVISSGIITLPSDYGEDEEDVSQSPR